MPPRTTTSTQHLRGTVALIERDGAILAQRTGNPGAWTLPCGDIRNGEAEEDALTRICGEELGISVRPHRRVGMLALPEQSCPVWHVLFRGSDAVTSTRSAVTDTQWFTVEELLALEPLQHREELHTLLQETDFREQVRRSAAHAPDTTATAPDETDVPSREQRILPLVQRAQAGDHEAFGALYDEFATHVYRYVAFRVPHEMAEDLTSDIFVKAWEKLHSYTERKNIPFGAWLFRIAHNVVVDTYRTHRPTVELYDIHMDTDRWNDPALQIKQEEQAQVVRWALNRLPPRYREALLLTYMSDVPNDEAARVLRVRPGSLRILKHRALRKLREMLPAAMREE